MPNIFVKIPAGAFDREAKSALVAGLNAAAMECERIPDEPARRFLCWVLLEEMPAQNWTCGGRDVSADTLPVVAVVRLPQGVLDDESRARYGRLIQRAFDAALPGDPRRLVVSCMFDEVPDGRWAANGEIWRLPQFAAAAGFTHLRHLAAP